MPPLVGYKTAKTQAEEHRKGEQKGQKKRGGGGVTTACSLRRVSQNSTELKT